MGPTPTDTTSLHRLTSPPLSPTLILLQLSPRLQSLQSSQPLSPRPPRWCNTPTPLTPTPHTLTRLTMSLPSVMLRLTPTRSTSTTVPTAMVVSTAHTPMVPTALTPATHTPMVPTGGIEVPFKE